MASKNLMSLSKSFTDYWVTIGTKYPEVYVYDNCTALHHASSGQQHIAALLHTEEKAISLKFANVGPQTNGRDCGVYAIAFATVLCLNKFPMMIFDDSKMRSTC